MAEREAPLSPLATPSATHAALCVHGLSAKHALGQNFLVNDAVVRRIVDLADLAAQDAVLEVGPGIGTLTCALLQRAGRVVSVELDADMLPVLADTCAPWADRFTLIQKDALAVEGSELADALRCCAAPGDGQASRDVPNKLVANLPYGVAATLVLDYFQRFPFLESATVMVQKEVADRIAAAPGSKDYGAYTVKLGLLTQVKGRFSVGAGNFLPRPRVESAVIRLDRRRALGNDGGAASPDDLRAACLMADAAFASRRKTIANSCKAYFAGRGEEGARALERLPRILGHAGIDPRRRGETLSLQEFVRLGEAYRGAVS